VYRELINKEKKIAVIGLGYVGLPLALAFAKKYQVIGYDISEERVEMLSNKQDPSKELDASNFENRTITFTANKSDLAQAQFYVLAIPTPVDDHKVPNLELLKMACLEVGEALEKGDYVVFESTVYPGCTEEECIPILEKVSGLKAIHDFKVAYSPERIVPGDKIKTIDKIVKVVSACDEISLEETDKIYKEIITAGTFKASSIKVAEAAKVIENIQRDLNISLMNELAIIFDKLDIDTQEVLKAAGSKWNFLKFYPGLVGGHCIGVDPYYLMHKAKEIGYDPQVILSGRRVNDGMPAFVAKKLAQMLIQKGKNLKTTKVLVMGVTFKENVSDIRNSKVADLIKELMDFSITVEITDPHASMEEFFKDYNLNLTTTITNNYDAVIVAVNHKEYYQLDNKYFKSIMNTNPILMDLKGIYAPIINEISYWRL